MDPTITTSTAHAVLYMAGCIARYIRLILTLEVEDIKKSTPFY